jgi:UTP--glucose-1-phosphate uridylyltransferase
MGCFGARKVRKAVIPAGGLGTRLLPFTKAVPKEMLPIGNKPLIQYAVEEAVGSGIQEIVLVTAPGNTTLQQYFSRSLPLEHALE